MIENGPLLQLAHPWRTVNTPPTPETPPVPAVVADPPKERSIYGLAAELKNLVREDRIYRASRKPTKT